MCTVEEVKRSRHSLMGRSRKHLDVQPAQVTEKKPLAFSASKYTLTQGLIYNKTGSLQPQVGPEGVFYSVAAFNANDLSSDQRVLEVEKDHLLQAILKSSDPSARGGNYLRQHLHQELLAQRRKSPGDLASALHRSIAELNKGFQDIHAFNAHVDIMQSLHVVIAFADFTSQRLVIASNGGCRCILGRSNSSRTGEADAVELLEDVGRNEDQNQNGIVPLSYNDIPIDSNVDFLILGSSGFWKEVAPFNAVLRAHHFFNTCPCASQASAAANLINYSLHCVTQRMKAHRDRRMISLNSVSSLVSLQTGNKGQFKWGHKQPVRRRRGDVHDDMTTSVAYFDWKGQLKGSLRQNSDQGVKQSKWNTVRMVFRFHKASRQNSLTTLRMVISQVLQQVRETKASGQNLLALKHSLHTSSESRSSDESASSEMSTYHS